MGEKEEKKNWHQSEDDLNVAATLAKSISYLAHKPRFLLNDQNMITFTLTRLYLSIGLRKKKRAYLSYLT